MSEQLLYLGTDDGVVTLRRIPSDWEEVTVGLKGQRIWALAHQPGHPRVIFAGSYGRGLFCSADGGQTWEARTNGLTFTYIRSILFDPANPRQIFVGTEPAAIFRSLDGGQSWEELTALRSLPGHERWYLPYSPRAGAVRTLAAVSHLPGSLYAGIEQGGVVFTYDWGDTWQLLDGGVNEDVHQVLVAANGGATIFAATGGGVFRSFDGGHRWEQVLADYTRAVATQPGHPAVIFAGPAARVGHEGRVERSRDEGSTWQPWTHGLPVPLAGMVDQFASRPGTLDTLGGLFAVLSTGEVYHTDLDQPDWVPITCGNLPQVNTIELAVG